MATQARFVTRKSKAEVDLDATSTRVLQQAWDAGVRGVEFHHYGLTDQNRADEIRRSYKRCGRKVKPAVSVKAYWRECTGCDNGGPECRYHIRISLWEPEAAAAYKAKQAEYAGS